MTPKFIEHIHLDIPKDFTPKFDEVGDIMSVTANKIWIKQVEKIDDEICKLIHDIAVTNGIDEVYVLDKKNILSALEKQIPKKPIWNMGWVCPNCKHEEILHFPKRPDWNDLFCKHCGQALDWSDTE